MILTRFTTTWPTHKQLPIFKKCFCNLLSLKTGSKIIALVWTLLFVILFLIEVKTVLNDKSNEQLRMRCLFNQTSNRQECPPESGSVFLYGYYNMVFSNHTQNGYVTSFTKVDDGFYEWSIFCTCLFYCMFIFFCVLLYVGIACDKVSFILAWLGLIQIIFVLEVCMACFDFFYLVKSEQYDEYLSFLFIVHTSFAGFIVYSVLLINSYVVTYHTNENTIGLG